MVKEFTDMKVKGISVSRVTGQFILEIVQESPFASFNDSGVTQNITLFSRRNEEVDDQAVQRTQDNLREQLGDDSIIFTDPSNATKDPNHIENWVESHAGTKIALVTRNANGFFDLGAGMTGGGSFGDSAYLEGHKATDGPYNPQKHRVPFFESLSAHQQEAVKSMDSNKYEEVKASTKSAYKGLEIPGLVTDVILSRANAYDSTTEAYSRQEVREEIIDSLNSGKSPIQANIALSKQIEALPDDFAYIDLIRILGGTDAENVSGPKQGLINGLLVSADRTTARFYVQNLETGYVFQSTGFKIGTNERSLNSSNNVQFEFLTGDFVQADLVRFLSNIAGLQGTELDITNMFEVAVEEGLYDQDKGEFNIADMSDLLHALRTWFAGRTVIIQSTLNSQARGRQDLDKLGTNIRSISLEKNMSAIQTSVSPTTSSNVTIDEDEDIEVEVEKGPETVASNPFAKAEVKTETVVEEKEEDVVEEEPAASNPFAKTVKEDTDAPANEDENDTDEDDEEEEDLSNNPFLK